MASTMGKKQAKVVKAYQKIFGSADGKLVLHDLMKTHGIFEFTSEETAHLQALRDGERNVVARIIKILKQDPDLVIKVFNDMEKQSLKTMEEYHDG